MITTPTVSGKPGQAPTGLSYDLYPQIGSHSTWTDPRGPVTGSAPTSSPTCPATSPLTYREVDAWITDHGKLFAHNSRKARLVTFVTCCIISCR
jgi:hypothetical protein